VEIHREDNNDTRDATSKNGSDVGTGSVPAANMTNENGMDTSAATREKPSGVFSEAERGSLTERPLSGSPSVFMTDVGASETSSHTGVGATGGAVATTVHEVRDDEDEVISRRTPKRGRERRGDNGIEDEISEANCEEAISLAREANRKNPRSEADAALWVDGPAVLAPVRRKAHLVAEDDAELCRAGIDIAVLRDAVNATRPASGVDLWSCGIFSWRLRMLINPLRTEFGSPPSSEDEDADGFDDEPEMKMGISSITAQTSFLRAWSALPASVTSIIDQFPEEQRAKELQAVDTWFSLLSLIGDYPSLTMIGAKLLGLERVLRAPDGIPKTVLLQSLLLHMGLMTRAFTMLVPGLNSRLAATQSWRFKIKFADGSERSCISLRREFVARTDDHANDLRAALYKEYKAFKRRIVR